MFKYCLKFVFSDFHDSIKSRVIVLLFIAILFYGCASTQDLVMTNKRVLEQTEGFESLKRTIHNMKEKDSGIEIKLQDLLTHIVDLETQIKHNQDQISTLEAKIEDYRQLLERSLSDNIRENEKMLIELERMKSSIEKFSKEMKAFQNAQVPDSSKAVYNTEDLSEGSFYDLAYETFKQGKFDKAREQFNSFLERFPKGKFSDNARFWIGECYYRKNEYEEAILEYEKVKNEYPSGDKVPSALFKQALSFLKLEKKDEARIILQDLVRHYPQSEQAGMAREQLEKLK